MLFICVEGYEKDDIGHHHHVFVVVSGDGWKESYLVRGGVMLLNQG